MELVSRRINFLNTLKTTIYIELGDLSPHNRNKVYGVVIGNNKKFFSNKNINYLQKL